MVKILVPLSIAIFLIFIQSNRVEEKTLTSICETTSDIRKCPEKLGKLFLPRTYSARAIYVGFSRDEIQIEFLESLINEVSKLSVIPQINVLVPRSEEYDAHTVLKKYFNKSEYRFINIIPTSSRDTLWAQDYLEILLDTKTGISEIVDLPYYDREGEDLPASVALYCQKDLIQQANFTSGFRPGNGDYGGNIEALTTKVLAVGNNISNETLRVLEGLTSQEIVELNVSWLETGHVDELITTLPYKKDSEACEQALLIASPQKALDIIEATPIDFEEQPNPHNAYFDGEITWDDYYHCQFPKNKKRPECLELVKANKVYQNIIDQDVAKLQDQFKKHHGCKLTEERFPQLFVPLEERVHYGSEDDRAVPLNPNSVNNIFFFPNLLLAKQSFEPFQKVIDEVLNKFPYKRIYINDKFAHELNGGIHCATNISYGCIPR